VAAGKTADEPSAENGPGEREGLPDPVLAQVALDRASDTAFWIGADARFLYVNAAACRALGYTRAELLRLTVHDVDPDLPRERWAEHWERARTRGTYVVETRHRAKDGRIFPVEVRGTHLRVGGLELHCSSAHDITQRKEAEAALRRNEERLRLALEASSDGIFDWNLKTGEAYFSPRYYTMLGYAPDDFAAGFDLFRALVHPEDLAAVEAQARRAAEERSSFAIELRMRAKDGTWRWVLSRGRVVGDGGPGGPLRMTGSHTDIQARKEAEAALRRSLAEKEVLLREVHHRVKNNLQVVSSLLSMQARSAGGVARDTFREAQARIRSMSLVHELLHRSRDLAHVDLPSYLDAVARGLEGSYAAGARKVTLVQEVAAVEVTADCAIPCGLVVNELVSNAYRHAFPGDRRGEVRLTVRQEPGGTLELTVADDGIGLPDGVDPDRSLGLRIVRLLAEQQLRGRLEVARARGTRFTVRFGGAPG
jgi:PAS domain S-box-containing protein